MERQLKQRLVGATVLVTLAVVFIPMILDDQGADGTRVEVASVPPRPTDDGVVRQLPVEPAPFEPSPVAPVAPDGTPAATVESGRDRAADVVGPGAEGADGATADTSGAPATTLPARAGYAVQVGSFATADNARSLVDALQKAGFRAFVEHVKAGAGDAYKVRVGPAAQRGEAQKLRDRLASEQKLEAIIVRYP